MPTSRNDQIRRTPQLKPTFAGLRRYGRREMAVDVVVQDADGWEIPLDSVDVSPTGIFVSSQYLFEIGDEHTLIFRIPREAGSSQDDKIFRMHARVARVEEGGQAVLAEADARTGMGYEFVDPEPTMWNDLCAIVAGA